MRKEPDVFLNKLTQLEKHFTNQILECDEDCYNCGASVEIKLVTGDSVFIGIENVANAMRDKYHEMLREQELYNEYRGERFD